MTKRKFNIKLPEDKFGFVRDESVWLVYDSLNNCYPQIKSALATGNLTEFINLLSQYSVAYVEQMAADHKNNLDFVDDYFSPARNFINFYHANQEFDETRALGQLSEITIIEYSWIYILCLQHKKRYLELIPNEKKKWENNKEDPIGKIINDVKFLIVRPFIKDLLSEKNGPERKICYAGHDLLSMNKAVQAQIKVVIDSMADKEDKSDRATLKAAQDKLMKIHTRLKENISLAAKIFNQDPREKMEIILALYSSTAKDLHSFQEALSRTLENPKITKHRNWLSRSCCLVSLFKPPITIKELKEIQNFCTEKKTPGRMRRWSATAPETDDLCYSSSK